MSLGTTVFASLWGLTALAYAAYISSEISLVLLGLVFLVTFILALKRLPIALGIAFIELMAFSHGHLIRAELFGFTLSLRMVLFAGIMLATGVLLLQGKRPMKESFPRPLVLLIAAIALGITIGAAFNPVGDVFADGNGYLYILYILPASMVVWNVSKLKIMRTLILSVAAYISSLTLVLIYLFSHVGVSTQRVIYTFIRDLRIAEVTQVSDVIYRIFSPAQFFIIIGFFILLVLVVQKKASSGEILLLGLFTSSLIASLSRSFWAAIGVGGIALLILLISNRTQIKRILGSIWRVLLVSLGGVALLWVLVAIPIPNTSASLGDFRDTIESRTDDDVAISSRWNLLSPMWTEIKENPLVGKGFGETVQYTSDDPRVREANPDGIIEVYAFEWGWIDLWLKMGILGPIAMIWLSMYIITGLLKQNTSALFLALGSGVIALAAAHFFSPYLNHPIGLGYLLVCLVVIQTSNHLSEVHIPG